MRIKARTLDELTLADAAYLGIPLYGHATYGQTIYMSWADAESREKDRRRKRKDAASSGNSGDSSAFA
jgi:hypothetical protein